MGYTGRAGWLEGREGSGLHRVCWMARGVGYTAGSAGWLEGRGGYTGCAGWLEGRGGSELHRVCWMARGERGEWVTQGVLDG